MFLQGLAQIHLMFLKAKQCLWNLVFIVRQHQSLIRLKSLIVWYKHLAKAKLFFFWNLTFLFFSHNNIWSFKLSSVFRRHRVKLTIFEKKPNLTFMPSNFKYLKLDLFCIITLKFFGYVAFIKWKNLNFLLSLFLISKLCSMYFLLIKIIKLHPTTAQCWWWWQAAQQIAADWADWTDWAG